MAVTEFDILRDEQERSNLLRAASDVETAIIASTPGTRRILENSLSGIKTRITTLDKRIEEAKVERAAEVQAQVAAAAALAARETALSASERETYKGFLQESYFTKKDLGRLDEFYTHSYDRLSEGGKDEMSKRLHEGIRRGEFKFSDLSQAIQERDNEHCSTKVTKEAPAQMHSNEREENSRHLSPTAETTAVKTIDLGSVDLSGVKLVEDHDSPSVSSLPGLSVAKLNAR